MKYKTIFLKTVLAISALLAAGCNNQSSTLSVSEENNLAKRNSKPNIILIMADDMGWGDTSYNGSAVGQTPFLDDMAKSGLVLDRSYAAAPVCSPTRASVLTGRHPFRSKVTYANEGYLSTDEKTLPEYLQEVGYKTGHFGKWHLGTMSKVIKDGNRGGRKYGSSHYSPPWLHGYDRVFATESKVPTFNPTVAPKGNIPKTWWDPIAREDGQFYGTAYWNEKGERIVEGLDGDDSKIIVDQVLPFINSAVKEDAPFLAVVWFHAPHLPVVASESDRADFSDQSLFSQHYYGSIKAMDRQIGRLREQLKAQGIADNTILWFTSDNGPENRNSGAPGSAGILSGEKRSLKEGGIRVPGIIEWPSKIKASTSSLPVSTSDILPTILAINNIDINTSVTIDGMNISSVFTDVNTERTNPIFFESVHQLSMIEGNYKILFEPDNNMELNNYKQMQKLTKQERKLNASRKNSQNDASKLHFKLVDLGKDPMELNDISLENPKIHDDMRAKFVAWQKSVAEDIARP